MIDNPEYEDDGELYVLPPLKFAGFEIWQVKAGTIFDNILLTDDLAEARAFADATWGASKAAEQAMYDAVQAEEDRARKEAADKARTLSPLPCAAQRWGNEVGLRLAPAAFRAEHIQRDHRQVHS